MEFSVKMPFELSKEDRIHDPDLEVARPQRLSVAASLLPVAYANALTDYRGLDGKAAALCGWIAAVFAIALFQHVDREQPQTSLLLLGSFLALIVSLCLAILLQRPTDVRGAGIMDPLDIYAYQAQPYWDYVQPEGISTDDLAAAQTQYKLIQKGDQAIKALRTASSSKQRLLFWSHLFFLAGIVLLAAFLLFPHKLLI